MNRGPQNVSATVSVAPIRRRRSKQLKVGLSLGIGATSVLAATEGAKSSEGTKGSEYSSGRPSLSHLQNHVSESPTVFSSFDGRIPKSQPRLLRTLLSPKVAQPLPDRSNSSQRLEADKPGCSFIQSLYKSAFHGMKWHDEYKCTPDVGALTVSGRLYKNITHFLSSSRKGGIYTGDEDVGKTYECVDVSAGLNRCHGYSFSLYGAGVAYSPSRDFMPSTYHGVYCAISADEHVEYCSAVQFHYSSLASTF